jgi:hypothetical protein
MSTSVLAPQSVSSLTLPTVERRATIRYPLTSEIFCRLLQEHAGHSAVPARARDISTGGLSLVAPVGFGQGTILHIELQTRTETFTQPLHACVMHATAQPDGQWFIGCAFLDKLSPDELKGLL